MRVSECTFGGMVVDEYDKIADWDNYVFVAQRQPVKITKGR